MHWHLMMGVHFTHRFDELYIWWVDFEGNNFFGVESVKKFGFLCENGKNLKKITAKIDKNWDFFLKNLKLAKITKNNLKINFFHTNVSNTPKKAPFPQKSHEHSHISRKNYANLNHKHFSLKNWAPTQAQRVNCWKNKYIKARKFTLQRVEFTFWLCSRK